MKKIDFGWIVISVLILSFVLSGCKQKNLGKVSIIDVSEEEKGFESHLKKRDEACFVPTISFAI